MRTSKIYNKGMIETAALSPPPVCSLAGEESMANPPLTFGPRLSKIPLTMWGVAQICDLSQNIDIRLRALVQRIVQESMDF
jgi:hypothetical protein